MSEAASHFMCAERSAVGRQASGGSGAGTAGKAWSFRSGRMNARVGRPTGGGSVQKGVHVPCNCEDLRARAAVTVVDSSQDWDD